MIVVPGSTIIAQLKPLKIESNIQNKGFRKNHNCFLMTLEAFLGSNQYCRNLRHVQCSKGLIINLDFKLQKLINRGLIFLLYHTHISTYIGLR